MPSMTDGAFQRLFVGYPAHQLHEMRDVPWATTPKEIGQSVTSSFEEKLDGEPRRRLVIDVRREDESWERLNPDTPLTEQGVLDGDHLQVSVEATAGGASVDFILGMLGGAALIPFVQAISTKAGEDVYAKVRELLGRRSQGRPVNDADIVVGHRRSKVVLRVPVEALQSPTQGEAEEPEHEEEGGEPEALWRVITWEPETGHWRWTHLDVPPSETVFVRRPWWRRARDQ
jgi:hypothetical protein